MVTLKISVEIGTASDEKGKEKPSASIPLTITIPTNAGDITGQGGTPHMILIPTNAGGMTGQGGTPHMILIPTNSGSMPGESGRPHQ
ncbi:MAG: hypothetical protein NPIRA01_16700 [Nitrospirales bacterium]|nr:MAG: hypothetical protein NPIRA01_16700 [Nitrospirales bacterium]